MKDVHSKMALGVLVLGALPACGPADTMHCPRFVGTDLTEALDRVDVDGDGQLTEADLADGESVMVFAFTKPNGATRIVTSRDASASMLSLLYQEDGNPPPDWGPTSLFGVWHEFTECTANGWSTPWFFDPDPSDPEPSSGTADYHGLSFDIADIEHGSADMGELDEGRVVVDIAGTASGHLEGQIAVDITSHFTQDLSGERVVLHAHAFRGLN